MEKLFTSLSHLLPPARLPRGGCACLRPTGGWQSSGGRQACRGAAPECGRRERQGRRRACSAAAAAEAEGGAGPATATQEAAPVRKKRVFSGVQPTGSLHLGNYLGAIRNWVKLQGLYDTYFCVVDLHAVTVRQSPAELLRATRSSAAIYLAAGIDPSRASIFVQSHVPAHAELAWLLQCCTPIGWLRRMVQFKEKSQKEGSEEASGGLLTYPVLMAADILLYQTDLVPVGDDQKQHLELARDIAARFNHQFGGKAWKKLGGRGQLLRVPETFSAPEGARVMSLTDGRAKMSKSAELDASRINLLDTPAEVAAKVRRAKTDAAPGLEADNPERPEAANLLTIYALTTGRSMGVWNATMQDSVLDEVGDWGWGKFKPALADAISTHLAPLQQRYLEAMADPHQLDRVLAAGREQASETAQWTLERCRRAMGLLPPC